MKILGFVVIREKNYDRIVENYEEKIKGLETKVGALQYENKRLGDIIAVLERYLEV